MTTPKTNPARTAPTGAPCWIDLLTSDPDRSRDFYAGLFGWTALPASAEFGGYFMFTRDNVPIAGAMPNSPDFNVADQWGVYLSTNDAAATSQAAAARGGELREPPVQIADLGTSATLRDCGGARIGMWQAGAFGGFATLAEPGAPAWFELHTRDYDASVAFYRDVFGWDARTMSDSDQFRYTTLGEGDEARAGIMDATGFLPDGAPAQWSVYFAVADADAAVSTATGLGASVVMQPEDTPFGRLATIVDPTGAQLKLMGPTGAP